jgi:hypothetical protein
MAPSIAGVLPLPTFTTQSTKASSGKGPSALFHHSLVTDNTDALKFHAAASLQLDFGHRNRGTATSDDELIVSPYNEPLHLLDMKRLDTPNQIFAKALSIMKPIRSDYATAGYVESFNWQAIIDLVGELSAAEGYEWKEQYFYVVVFRSHLNAGADLNLLHDLDYHSHEEATASGGLLKYWFGSQDENHRNLATCKSRGAIASEICLFCFSSRFSGCGFSLLYYCAILIS